MNYRFAASLWIVLLFVGCAATDIPGDLAQAKNQTKVTVEEEPRRTILRLKAGADCPGTILDATDGVLCLFEYPTIGVDSHQKIVKLKSGADCPGLKLDGLSGVLCVIEYPKGWRPYVYDGLLFYKIELADS